MLKRLSLVLLVVSMVMPLSACRFAAPMLEDMSGGGCCGGCNDGCTTKSDLILRQWARDARRGEECVDALFLNYDRNDPYRGDYYVLDGEGCCSR